MVLSKRVLQWWPLLWSLNIGPILYLARNWVRLYRAAALQTFPLAIVTHEVTTTSQAAGKVSPNVLSVGEGKKLRCTLL